MVFLPYILMPWYIKKLCKKLKKTLQKLVIIGQIVVSLWCESSIAFCLHFIGFFSFCFVLFFRNLFCCTQGMPCWETWHFAF